MYEQQLFAVVEQQNPYAGQDGQREVWVEVQRGPLNRHQALAAMGDVQRSGRRGKMIPWRQFIADQPVYRIGPQPGEGSYLEENGNV